MSLLFISHSGRNNDAARKVADWLQDQGWGEVFLDLDPAQGLAPGQRWQDELRRAGERCSAVIVLISPDWAASSWCRTEFLVAVQLGKKIFPVIVADTPFQDLPVELIAHFQLADISKAGAEEEGFERLALGLKRAGLDPSNFAWPPPGDEARSPFRGLATLEEIDAAIFFGRDGAITRGLDTFRRLRDGAEERGIVIVGPSGVGKSSFLRAGLLARLERDEANFLVLPAIRPETSALSGPQGFGAALEKAAAAHTCPVTRAEIGAAITDAQSLAGIFAKLRGAVTARHERYARQGMASPPPTIVVAIDQAEELFHPACQDGEDFLSALAKAASLDANVILVSTIRSEIYYRWQTARPLGDFRSLPFNLPPLSLAAFGEIIRGPAALARPPLKISHELVEALSNELDKADALPLLAATLERLYADGRKKGEIGLDDYHRLGGLEGTISRAADAAISDAARDSALPRELDQVIALTRRLFVPWLVTVDVDTREPKRQSASLAKLPEEMRQLARHFVEKRLLVVTSGPQAGGGTIDIVHDSVLRCWPALAAWIAQEQVLLIQLDSLVRAAREWDGQQRSDAWLFHQNARLREAEALLERPDFSQMLGATAWAYVSACRQHEDRILDDERARIDRELRQIVIKQRFQRIAAGLTALAMLIVVLVGIRTVLVARSENLRASTILAGLSESAADRGLYSRAERYALSAAFGADAALVGFDDGAAHRALVRSLNANHQLMRLPAGNGIVFDANYSPDGAMIVTAGADGTARIWDAKTGRQMHVLSPGHNALTSAKFSPDSKSVVTASQDGVVRFWDAKTGELTGRLPQVLADLRSIAYSPDGNSLVTSAGLTAMLWDLRSQTVTQTVSGAGQVVLDAVFSPDGSRIATGSADFAARVWDIKTKRTIAQFPNQNGIVAQVSFSPDGNSLATISGDGSLRIFDIGRQALSVELPGHEGPLSAVRYSADGRWIVTAAEDGAIQLWSVVAQRMVGRFSAEHSQVNSASFSQDGRFIVSGDEGGGDVWQVPGDIAYVSSSGIESAELAQSNTRLLTGSADGRAHIMDLQTQADVAATGDNAGAVMEAVFSPDEKTILTASRSGQARLWDAQSGSLLRTFGEPSQQMNEAEFAPGASQIVTAAMDGFARLWNPDTGQAGPALHHNQSGVITAVFSDDGKKVATAGNDRIVRIWDSASGRLLRALSSQAQEVNEVRFVPGTKFLLTGSDDKKVILWNAETGAKINVMNDHTGYVRSLAVSPNGRLGASGALDGTVRVWDLRAGTELFRFEDFGGTVRFLAFSPDGARLVATATDRTVRIWPLTGNTAPVSTALDDRTVIALACRSLSQHGLQELKDEEVDVVAKLVPGLGQDVCAPHSSLARIRELLGL